MRARSISIVLAAAGLTLAALIVFRVAPALRHHGEALDAIQRLGTVNASRSLLVMRARYNLLDNYDPINASTRAFDRILDGLVEAQTTFSDRDHALRTATASAVSEVRRVEEMIEDFKSSAAVLRNSLANLPALLDDSRAHLENAPSTGPRATVVDNLVVELVQSLIEFAFDGTPEAEERVLALGEALGRDPPDPSAPARAPLVERALAHTELVLSYHRRTDALLQGIVTAPIERELRTVATWHTGRLQTIGGQRTGIDGALIAVACGLIAIVARLVLAQRRSRLLLEVRVADRTRDLAALNENLRRANQAKTTFLANMSHEIRTPLTAVLGYAEILEQPDLSPAERGHLTGVIQRSGQHLLTIINDILDITKIEAGGLRLESIDCSPGQLVEEVCAWMRHRAEEKGLTLTAQLPTTETLPARIRADPTRLRQVLVNLIGNAIKFTPKGEVVVQVDHCELPGGGRLDFTVRDTGIGMTAEQIGRIFEEFSQADSSTSRTFGGTGLGLAICRRLITAMGGHIQVTSRPGRGSTFTFDLPLAADQLLVSQAASLTAVATSPTDGSSLPVLPTGVRVLIADDSPDNHLIVSHFLTTAGAKVSSVFSGNEAVRAAIASVEAHAPFSVILMDLQMPELGGLDALSAIRKAGVQIPVVALTASVYENDQAHCIEAGCAGFLGKPVVRRALLQTVASLSGSQPGLAPPEVVPVPAPTSATPEAPFDPARLLLLLGGDLSLRDALLELARVEIPAQFAILVEATTAGDRGEMVARAHRLKGALGSLCATQAAARAAAIEEAAAKDGRPELIERTVASLREDVGALAAAIAAFRQDAAGGRAASAPGAVRVTR